MRDRDRAEALDQAIEALTFVRDNHCHASRKLDEYRGKGYPSKSSIASDIHKARGVGDPTGYCATSEHDLAGSFDVDRGHLDEWTENVLRHSGKLRKLVVAAISQASRDKVDAECRVCALHTGFRVTVFANELCEWHYRFQRDWGCVPHEALSSMHAQGRRVTHQKVKSFHPEAVYRGEGEVA